ncbi:MAG: hypothetical protein LBT10_01255 [Methanobrevibacter sp.]|jgi:hypothetical protein|nr:hypothetical protein [Methanobrevibacter sp.]
MNFKIYGLLVGCLILSMGLGAASAATTLQAESVQKTTASNSITINIPYLDTSFTLNIPKFSNFSNGAYSAILEGKGYSISVNQKITDLINSVVHTFISPGLDFTIKNNLITLNVPDITATVDVVNGIPKKVVIPDTQASINAEITYKFLGITITSPINIPVGIPGAEYILS